MNFFMLRFFVNAIKHNKNITLTSNKHTVSGAVMVVNKLGDRAGKRSSVVK